MELATFLNSYGPLGLGWISVVVLYQDNLRLRKEITALHEKFHDLATQDIEIKTGMMQRLRELADVIRKGFGDV